MGTQERRTRQRQETRDKILDAAREMFAEEGYDSVTMRAIAERIEYTPTAIYHHFESKQALLTELCECDFAALAQRFVGQAAATDPVERILAVGRAYLRFAEEYPSQYRFMFMTVFPNIEDSKHRRGDPERDAYAFLRGACQEAIDQGRLRPELTDPDRLAQILWSTVHGLISLRMVKRHDFWVPWSDLRETAEAAMQALLHGILREEQRASGQ
jgi:AcrR family transcriptional regulator